MRGILFILALILIITLNSCALFQKNTDDPVSKTKKKADSVFDAFEHDTKDTEKKEKAKKLEDSVNPEAMEADKERIENSSSNPDSLLERELEQNGQLDDSQQAIEGENETLGESLTETSDIETESKQKNSKTQDLEKFEDGTAVTCIPDARKIEFRNMLQEGEELNNEVIVNIIGTEAARIFDNKLNENEFYLSRTHEDVQKIVYKAELEITSQKDDWEREKNDKEYNMFSAMKEYYQDKVNKNQNLIQMQQDSMAVERYIQEKNMYRFEKGQYERIINTLKENKNAHFESSPHRIMLIGKYGMQNASKEAQDKVRKEITAKLKDKAIALGIEVEKTVIKKLIQEDDLTSEIQASIERVDGVAYLHTTFHKAVKINETKTIDGKLKLYSTQYIINIYDVFPRFSGLPTTGEIGEDEIGSNDPPDTLIDHEYDIYRFNSDSQMIESVIHDDTYCDLNEISKANKSVDSVINEMLHYMNIQDNLINSKNDKTTEYSRAFVNKQNETIEAYIRTKDETDRRWNVSDKELTNKRNSLSGLNETKSDWMSKPEKSFARLKEIETDYEAYISGGNSTSIIKTKTFDTTEFSGSISEGIKEAISFINYDEVYQKLQASRSSTVKYKAEHSYKDPNSDEIIHESDIQYNKETILFDPKITAFKILVLNPLKGAMQDVSIAVQLFVHWVPQAKIEYITSPSGVMNYIKLTDNSTDYHYKLVHEGEFTYATSLKYLFGTNYRNISDQTVRSMLDDGYKIPTLAEFERFISAFNVSLITYEDNSLREDPFGMLGVQNYSELTLAVMGENGGVIDEKAYHLEYNRVKRRIEATFIDHKSGSIIELMLVKEIK